MSDFIPKPNIENAAIQLLNQYGLKFGVISEPPVPIEEIVECLLDLTFDIDDLATKLGIPDILGATWLDDKRVVIDESLDPDSHPEKEGRYRFTIAHEVGHWILHAPRILAEKRQPTLFEANDDKPSIVCRSSQQKEPKEWQADYFASHLLMPTELIRSAWNKHTEERAPKNVACEIQRLRKTYSIGKDEYDPSCKTAKIMAELFNVSAQAMQIRLQDIGLLKMRSEQRGLLNR